jgi:hypothetical protein
MIRLDAIKAGAVLCCLSVGGTAHSDTAEPATVVLPAPIRAALDASHPGWRLSSVSAEVRRFIRTQSLTANPTMIKGDFDGDGRTDYAVLLDHPDSTHLQGPSRANRRLGEVIAVLNVAGVLKIYSVRTPFPPEPERYLVLRKKGARGYDIETDRHFRFQHDAIGIGYFGVAQTTCFFTAEQTFECVAESN